MQRDGIADVEQVKLGIEKANFPPLALHLEIDNVTAQQPIHLPDIGLHRLDFHCAETHGAPCREA